MRIGDTIPSPIGSAVYIRHGKGTWTRSGDVQLPAALDRDGSVLVRGQAEVLDRNEVVGIIRNEQIH